MSQLFHDLAEINDFFRLDTLRGQFVLRAKEGLSCRAKLREAIVYHLLRAININGPHLVKLVDPLLGHPFIEVLLFSPQVAQIMVNFGERCRFLVDLFIGGFTFRVDSEAFVHAIRDVFGSLGAERSSFT